MNSENQSELRVSWNNIVRFVRQLSHDLRNDLNAAQLQAVDIGELTGEDTELKQEVKRLRETIAKLATTLQGLSFALGQISPTKIPYGVSDFVEDLREKLLKDSPADGGSIKWEVQIGKETFDVDPQLLQQALLEVFLNAFRHERGEGALSASARIDNGKFVFMLREPKTDLALPTENWGREPLARVRQGHYGLGLNRVRVILEAHGGELRAQYDSKASELVTTITLPVSGKEK